MDDKSGREDFYRFLLGEDYEAVRADSQNALPNICPPLPKVAMR